MTATFGTQSKAPSGHLSKPTDNWGKCSPELMESALDRDVTETNYNNSCGEYL